MDGIQEDKDTKELVLKQEQHEPIRVASGQYIPAPAHLQHYSGHLSGQGVCPHPATLFLSITAFLFCLPAGIIAFHYYSQGELSNSRIASVIGIIIGTIATVIMATMMGLYMNGQLH